MGRILQGSWGRGSVWDVHYLRLASITQLLATTVLSSLSFCEFDYFR